MELLVLNESFEAVGVIDTFESVIWTDRFFRYGDFEIYIGIGDEASEVSDEYPELCNESPLQQIKTDYYIWTKDSDRVMIVESLLTDTDIESGNHLTVTGRSLESILERRIIWGQVLISGNFQDAIEQLINSCIISPEIEERKIDNFVFKRNEDPRITELTIKTQYTGDNLYDVIQKECEERNIGFKVILNDDNQFEFSLFCGEDRSYDQTKNPYVIFSPNFDNIINSSYLESKKMLKNVALVAGEGEGVDRKVVTIGSGSGLHRRELFVDARDVSSNTGEVVLSDEEYLTLLSERGEVRLSENVELKSFEGQVDATQMFVYGVDFFIGDIVQIENEYGKEGKSYISELIMSQNLNGFEIYPTFTKVPEEE